MEIPFITFAEGDAVIDWATLTDALADGHKGPKAEIADSFLYRGDDTLLSRAAWIDGLGIAVKCATIMPGNPARNLPMVNGAMMLFDDETGQLEALLDFHLVTKWKTAGDSLLGAKLLARPDSKRILLVGSGTVAGNLVAAYSSHFPDLSFDVWSRTRANAEKLAERFKDTADITVVDDLAKAANRADIICCATMSTEPVIKGEWLRAGQHLDLIGAYRPDMREVDDAALTRSRIFVDSRATTLGHIGELKIPLEAGTISEADIQGDFHDLIAGTAGRRSDEEITLFKNGGGAHLDLMTGKAILKAWRNQ